jgi:hypothetical protein
MISAEHVGRDDVTLPGGCRTGGLGALQRGHGRGTPPSKFSMRRHGRTHRTAAAGGRRHHGRGWHAAFAALSPPASADLRAMPDRALHGLRDAYQAETAWAPPRPGDKLRLARPRRASHRERPLSEPPVQSDADSVVADDRVQPCIRWAYIRLAVRRLPRKHVSDLTDDLLPEKTEATVYRKPPQHGLT